MRREARLHGRSDFRFFFSAIDTTSTPLFSSVGRVDLDLLSTHSPMRNNHKKDKKLCFLSVSSLFEGGCGYGRIRFVLPLEMGRMPQLQGTTIQPSHQTTMAISLVSLVWGKLRDGFRNRRKAGCLTNWSVEMDGTCFLSSTLLLSPLRIRKMCFLSLEVRSSV